MHVSHKILDFTYSLLYVCMYVSYIHVCTYICILCIRILMQMHNSICISDNALITNRMATVAINGLQCGVTYNITAEEMLNGVLVGPGSSHGSITTGPCPVIASECILTKHEISTKKCLATCQHNIKFVLTFSYQKMI